MNTRNRFYKRNSYDIINREKEKIVRMKYKKYESGRSMVEIIGVLAIMGMIAAGATMLISNGMTVNKRARVRDDVSAIVENVRGLYPDKFTNLTDDETQGTILIDSLYLNTTTPYGPGTSYSVVRVNKDEFNVIVSGLDDDECSVLIKQTWAGVISVSRNPQTGGPCKVTLKFGK